MASYDNAPGKIFIGGISPNTTQDSIQKYFEQFGELCDCVLMQDKATGKSRCFGFVTYKDPQILDDVLSKKHSIDGKEIDCKRAIPRDQQPESGKEGANYRTKKLFVGGLTQTTTEEQFRGYFEQFGEIEDSVIMTDKETGKSRGFGFITFVSEDSVDQVIERYNDNKIDGKWVECKRAQAKDVMQAGKQKGGRHDSRGGPSGGDYRRHGDGGSRRDDRSRGTGGGYYQNSPTSQSGSGRRGGPSGGGSRSQGGQDNYGGGYYQGGGYGGQGGYPGGPRGNYEGAPYGAYPGYDYAGQPGYGAGADGRGPAGGYGYNQDYSAYSNPNYPNPYQNPYNPGYASGYPGQYNPNYGQQGYDMMAGGNPQASNPSASATASTKSGDVPTSMSQMSANPYAQAGGAGGYGGEGQYNPTAYGYNPMPQGDYGYGSYGQPGGQQGQGGQAKYGGGPVGQVQSPSQVSGGGYQRPSQAQGQGQGQSDIGPMKGSAKKSVDQRHYQPY